MRQPRPGSRDQPPGIGARYIRPLDGENVEDEGVDLLGREMPRRGDVQRLENQVGDVAPHDGHGRSAVAP